MGRSRKFICCVFLFHVLFDQRCQIVRRNHIQKSPKKPLNLARCQTTKTVNIQLLLICIHHEIIKLVDHAKKVFNNISTINEKLVYKQFNNYSNSPNLDVKYSIWQYSNRAGYQKTQQMTESRGGSQLLQPASWPGSRARLNPETSS